MSRTLVALMMFAAVRVRAEEPVDGGLAPPPAIVDAGVPATLGFDVVRGPWGPARRSSGEQFRSAATPVGEGPLRWRWADYSLAIGGQYFARAEVRDGRDFDFAAQDHTLGVDHRARLTVRASAKERVGVLLELQDVRGWGSETNTLVVMPFTGLHQGFVDVKVTSFLDVRVGRQELSYGEERLIGNLDWAQTARAFDGVFVRVTASPSVTLDAFGMLLAPPAWLTDASGARFHNSGSYFTGLYARARLGKAGFDVYGLGLLEDPSSAALGARHDNNRLTLGARGFGALGPLALLGEAAFQTGKSCSPACVQGQTDDAVLAGSFAVRATYTAPVWGAPYVLGEFLGASGDGTPADGVDHTFHQLFPTGHAQLGFMDYVGWQNVVAARGTLGFRPWGAHVWLDVRHYRAWDPTGAWYASNGSVFLPADATRASGNMGTELDLSITVPVFDNVALAGAVAVFLPGLEASARGTAPSTWGFLSVRSQF
ncbi:MAG: alginate export family protein [Archangium sp.]|nr:alginate export family protein [Archangium sp.]